MSMRNAIRRELRVAFSRKAQPVWFRVAKWILAVGISVLLWPTPYFWLWILGAPGLGLTVTSSGGGKPESWARPWGGWEDVEAAKQD
jgi:hypothetical protein